MVLRVENLSFQYNKKRKIFQDVQFSLNKGEIMNILGNNGAGKSTLLNCVAGIYKPATGKVWLDGKDSAQMPMREVARLVGYVPQISHATVAYSVLDFVVMGRTPYIGLFSKPGKEDYEIALEALQRLNIEKLRDKLYTELSGGERQQVCIARAIAQKPELILLDEPTAHLDYGNQYRTVAMVKKLAEEGYAVMMTTHNPDHAVLLGGKTAILGRDGNLKVGETSDMINSETMSELYGMKIETTYSEIAGRKLCIVV